MLQSAPEGSKALKRVHIWAQKFQCFLENFAFLGDFFHPQYYWRDWLYVCMTVLLLHTYFIFHRRKIKRSEKIRKTAQKKFYLFRNRREKIVPINWMKNIGSCCWNVSNNLNDYQKIELGFDAEPNFPFIFKIVGGDCWLLDSYELWRMINN